MTNFEIVFLKDNTALLQTNNSCHYFEEGWKLEEAVCSLLDSDDPSLWDGNYVFSPLEQKDLGPQDSLHTIADVIKYLVQGIRYDASRLECSFYCTLSRTIRDTQLCWEALVL